MVQSASKKLSLKSVWPQWLAAFGAILMTTELGLVIGWTSPYLVKLTADDSELHLTLSEASWVASLPQLTRTISAIVVSMCVHTFGSKTTILISCLPMTLNWVLTIVADSVEWLYAARISGGLTFGLLFGSFPLYLGEIANPEIRGALVALATAGISTGICLGTVLGSYFSMPVTGWICFVPCILSLILFSVLPESPHHLIRKRNLEAAKRSVVWYNRSTDVNANANARVEALEKFILSTDSQSFLETLRELNIPHIRKATILTTMLYIFMQMCGLSGIFVYIEIILVKGKVVSIDTSLIVIIANAMGIVAAHVTMFFMDKYGRKTLLVISSVATALSLAGLSLHFFLLKLDYDPANLEWLPITSLIIYVPAVYVGLLPVPNIVFSEILPPNIKCIAASIIGVVAGLSAFLSSKTYQMLVDLVEERYMFLIYSIFIVMAVPYCLFFMPETKGKTLQEIQDKLVRRHEKSQQGNGANEKVKQNS